jgi:hypothetical protein
VGVACGLNSWVGKNGIFSREVSRINTGSENMVGKTALPISFPISPDFPGFFPNFRFSRENDI